MKELIRRVSFALCELKSASMGVVGDPKEIMNKYNMLFLGEKFNWITGNEFRVALKDYFGVDITKEQLNVLLPVICENLGMDHEPMIDISDTNNPEPATFSITLWK